ncbi:alpha/beta family hydrolase [Marinomonas ostreistagni]|uniref:Hydrolase n=1 Tax=Marinomonas ostreistagni TaxID=359209 RepID=A0ABS0Z759_9GAMM|nr:alpha/beta family hydrolase [Marinomonas ostreistagni]MBJ7549495.1 hydrolase [Marinomonas ostreistagni]
MGIPCHRATFSVDMSNVYLLHGAGAGHESVFLQAFKHELEVLLNATVTPITLSYMKEIEKTGKKRPPPRLPKLVTEVGESIDAQAPVVLIGKSMGGRIIAELCQTHDVKVCVALGFPFYPAKKEDKHRLENLQNSNGVPYLVCQGTRDSLGAVEWVTNQVLPSNVKLHWIEGADHDFHVLKRYNRSQVLVIKELAKVSADFIANHETNS